MLLDADFVTYAIEISDKPPTTRQELIKQKFSWFDDETVKKTFKFLKVTYTSMLRLGTSNIHSYFGVELF